MDKIHLIKLCQSGDREALGILYQTYLIPMREIVAYYVNNTDAVWDILHDGFLVAFASIGSLKNSEKVEPWLASIMKNLAFQYLRDKSKNYQFLCQIYQSPPISTRRIRVCRN